MSPAKQQPAPGLNSGQKGVLILMIGGLALIVLVLVAHRYGGNELFEPSAAPQPQASANAPELTSEQLPTEIPQAMLEALAAQGMNLSDLGLNVEDGLTPDNMLSGMPSGMIDALQQMQSQDSGQPTSLDTLLDMVFMFLELSDLTQAQNFANQALVAAPSDPRPYYAQGRIYQAQGLYQQAADIMERSLNLGDSPNTRHDLAQLYAANLGNPAKAIEHLNAAIALPDLDPHLKAHYQEELDALSSN